MAELRLARLPKLQVMVVVALQLPCVALVETKLTPAGSRSVIATPVAGEGPLFVTTMRYVRLVKAIAGFGEAVLLMKRLALVGPVTIKVTGVDR